MNWAEIITFIITTFVGGFGGFIWGRKKYNTEVDANYIQNFNSAIDAYKKLYEDREQVLSRRIDELTEENKELRKQVTTISNFITTYMLNYAGSCTAPKETVEEILKLAKTK